MEKLNRRKFCGTAIMAIPLLSIQAKAGLDLFGTQDSVIDALADEIARITNDGERYGFQSRHFERYAGVVRTFDAYMEQSGKNKDFSTRLDEDDFERLNPVFLAHTTVQYWQKRNLEFDENALAAQLTFAPADYRETKKLIKNHGGVGALHKRAADAFDQRAKLGISAMTNGARMRSNALRFGNRRTSNRPQFVQASFQDEVTPMDIIMAMGLTAGGSLDCLCKALLVEGSVAAILCALVVCPVCCPAAAILIAIRNLLEAFGVCNANRC